MDTKVEEGNDRACQTVFGKIAEAFQ